MKALNVLAQFCLVLLMLSTGSCTQHHPSTSSNEIVFAIGQMPLNLDPRYATASRQLGYLGRSQPDGVSIYSE
jgi:hypothetical protein